MRTSAPRGRAESPVISGEEGGEANRHDRIIVDGPNVALPANSSLMLTMCLHELATNAAKYGALSMLPGGFK